MRILAVVQRFGPDIAGGAEQLAAQLSLRLVEAGHHVEVLTSTAANYTDWAPHFDRGTTTEGGVVIHRLDARHTRDGVLFNGLHERTARHTSNQRFAAVVGNDWARRLGPDLIGFEEWLTTNAERFDIVWFSGYMYMPTTVGLPLVAPFVPTALQSVAHDEPALHLPTVARVMQHVAGINFLSPEEETLVVRRFRPAAVHRVIGAGVTLPDFDFDRSIVRSLGLDDRPYLVCVGRIDPGKGTLELVEMFKEYQRLEGAPRGGTLSQESPPSAKPTSDLRLVLVGESVHPIAANDHVVVTGFLPEAQKWALIEGARVLVQPSLNESFSLSLVEGWLCGVPALVQRGSEVLAGQVRRASGGMSYAVFSEFAASLDVLLASPQLRVTLGENGRSYARQYEWSQVTSRFVSFLESTIEHYRSTESDGFVASQATTT